MADPPADLAGDALAKWHEFASQIDGDYLDADALAAYCRAFAEEQAALRMLALLPNPFLVAESGKVEVNPLRRIIDRARAEQSRLRRELRRQKIKVMADEPLSDRERLLLTEIDRRHRAVADSPTSDDDHRWEVAFEFGPSFSATAWFAADDAERMRWTRALDAIADRELVVVTRFDGEKCARVRLTQDGEAMLAEADTRFDTCG